MALRDSTQHAAVPPAHVRGRAFTTTFGTTPTGGQWIKSSDQLDAQLNWRVAKGLQMTTPHDDATRRALLRAALGLTATAELWPGALARAMEIPASHRTGTIQDGFAGNLPNGDAVWRSPTARAASSRHSGSTPTGPTSRR